MRPNLLVLRSAIVRNHRASLFVSDERNAAVANLAIRLRGVA